MGIKRYIKYLNYVLRHKWFVSLECFKRGIIWRGILHDLSKFLPSEFIPYARFFYEPDGASRQNKIRDKTGYYKPTDSGDEKFDKAWLAHIHRNAHHWQHHILFYDTTCSCNTNYTWNIIAKQNIVKDAVLKNQSKSFLFTQRLMEDTGSYAKNTGKNTVEKELKFNIKKIQIIGKKDIERIQSIIKNMLKKQIETDDFLFLNIMEERYQSVLVVEKKHWNSCVLTTSTEGATSTIRSLENKELTFINGWLEATFPKDSEFYVTTVTPPWGFMDIAPINGRCPSCKESVVPYKCFSIEEEYIWEMLNDWIGAGKAQGFLSPKDKPMQETIKWYKANKSKMQLHPDSRKAIEKLIKDWS